MGWRERIEGMEKKEEGTAVRRQGQELGEERVKIQEQNQIN